MRWDVDFILSAAAVFLFLSVSSISDFRSRTISLGWIRLWMAAGLVWDICKVCSGDRMIAELLCAVIPGACLLCMAYFSGAAGMGDGFAWLVVGLFYGSENCWGAFAASLFFIFVWSAGLLILKRSCRKARLPFLPFSLAGTVLWATAVSARFF